MGEALINALISAHTETAVVWRSPVWDYLDPNLSEKSCESRLFEACGVSRPLKTPEELLKEIVERALPPLGDDLMEVSRLVLALRVARQRRSQALTLLLASKLAYSLLLLSGCPYRRASSEQLWVYCGRTLVKDLEYQSRRVKFENRTWNFIADHAMRTRSTVELFAYASPMAKTLPFTFVEELLHDIVSAVTAPDADRATFIMSRLSFMAPDRFVPKKIPDVETLSIWHPLSM